jgi:hypothetical protein
MHQTGSFWPGWRLRKAKEIAYRQGLVDLEHNLLKVDEFF